MIIQGAYQPIVKQKLFLPNPVVRYGIPESADSKMFPNVLGTVAHEDYWNEQIHRCLYGYDTGGIHIPGRYYYYLNFCMLDTPTRGNHYADYVDLDLEFFRLVDWCKENNKGIISLKRRRGGVSFKFAHGVFGYGLRFTPKSYKAAVVAGLGEYSADFFAKIKECNTLVPPELFLHHHHDNEEEWVAGYKKDGQKDGSFNTIVCKTANKSPNVLKGKGIVDCVFEEGGEFVNLIDCFNATKACFMVGTEMVGTPFAYGTAGNIKSSSKAFKEMISEPDNYDLVPFDIFGTRMMVGYFMGSTNVEGKVVENCPNIKKMQVERGLSDEQVLGCEDVVACDEWILKDRARLSTAVNKSKYYEHFKDYPRNRKEAFLNFSGNLYDPEVIAAQIYEISTLVQPKYRLVHLVDKCDDKGNALNPRVIEIVAAKPTDKEDSCWLMLEEPHVNFKNMYTAGGDAYDVDQTHTSKSLGAFVVLQRRDITAQGVGAVTKRPVLLYRGRPARREIFYDECLKASILYDLIGNTLFDVAGGGIIDYYTSHQGKKYLALRPKAFESATSEQSHLYGYRFTSSLDAWNMVTALVQSWVLDYANQCWFPHILSELSDYDTKALDSDWDSADALMLALIQDTVQKRAPETKDADLDKRFQLPVWHEKDGVMYNKNQHDAPTGPRHSILR